jgi:ADP-L-glycero-D-manno-heptose 6-epimerase
MISVVKVKYDEIAAGRAARLFRSDRPDVADGELRRDFVHVDDCADAITWLLVNPHVSGLFNLGTGRARTYLDLVHAIYAALDRPPEVEFIDMPANLRGQYQSFTEARMDRLRAAGWPGQSTPLELGVASYVQRYLSQPDPYR